MNRKKKADDKKAKGPRDLSKVSATRKICYCQASSHPLVNNCANCGKIVCELEGEGPCLFCGAWIDRDIFTELEVDEEEYTKALEHRNKLIEFDYNSA